MQLANRDAPGRRRHHAVCKQPAFAHHSQPLHKRRCLVDHAVVSEKAEKAWKAAHRLDFPQIERQFLGKLPDTQPFEPTGADAFRFRPTLDAFNPIVGREPRVRSGSRNQLFSDQLAEQLDPRGFDEAIRGGRPMPFKSSGYAKVLQ